jgi:hypothetical protein
VSRKEGCSEAELRAAAAAIRRRFCAAPLGGLDFDKEQLKEMRWLELEADYAWLRKHGWVAGPWVTRQREKRYGDGEYTVREWRCGRMLVVEHESGLWRSANWQVGNSCVVDLLEWTGLSTGQLALDIP